MPLKPKNKSDPTIEERVSNLEREYSTINKLYKIVQNLEKQITNGHFCKWNIEMGKIIEFRREQNIFRESLEKDLTQSKKEIQNLKLILNELKTGKQILERVEESQKIIEENRETENRRNRRAVYLAVFVVLLTFLMNLALDIIKQNI